MCLGENLERKKERIFVMKLVSTRSNGQIKIRVSRAHKSQLRVKLGQSL